MADYLMSRTYRTATGITWATSNKVRDGYVRYVSNACKHNNSCPWCVGNRTHSSKRRAPIEEKTISDISMCKNKKCPLNDTCYRYLAEADNYQLFADFQYDSKDEPGCISYWPFSLNQPPNEDMTNE